MADPTFKTRAELEAWRHVVALRMGWGMTASERLDALSLIRRVTLAHSHLIGDT